MGQAPKGASYNTTGDGHPLVAGAGDFTASGISPGKWTTEPTRLSHPGDVVLSIRASIGEKRIADQELCLGRGVAGIRATDAVDPGYLWHAIGHLTPALKARARGATFVQVNGNDVRQAHLPLPPLTEQRRIATILNRVNYLHKTNQESISRLTAARHSIFRSRFNGPSLPKTPLSEHLSFLTSGSRGWAKYYAESGAAFLRIQNVYGGKVHLEDLAYVNPPQTTEASRTRVQTGDVLLSITADLGRTAVIPPDLGPAHINQHLAILRSQTLIPEYLATFLDSSPGRHQLVRKNRGQTKDGLNFTDIRSVEIPTPSLKDQTRFKEDLSHLASVQENLARRERLIASLMASTQARAFRGSL